MNGKDALFVDKSAWFALADRSDHYHKKAINIYPGLIKSLHHLTTTNLIIAETYILIRRSIGHQVRRSIGHQAAIIFLESINSSSQIRKIYSDRALEEKAEEILRKYQDQDFSYTDAVSFTVMKQYGIGQAFSFDELFITAGFILIP